MIIGFIGQRNSGKTLTMTLEAYKKFKEGYTIYSNYHLNFPYTHYDINDLMEFAESGVYFNDCIFLVDEIHIMFDSRSSGKARNRIFSYWLNMSSKGNFDVWYTTQFSRQVEIRLRLNTEIVVESNCRAIIWATKKSKPRICENERPKPNDYKCSTFITTKMIKFSDTGRDKIIVNTYKGDKFYKLYDTRQVIKQQKDLFELAKERHKENKGLEREKKLTYKEKRAEQHANRLFHEENEKMLRGGAQ